MARAYSLLGTIAGVLLSSSVASAHLSLEQAGTHKSRYGDGNDDIKDGPCGHENGTRGTNVYTYKPGETITISVREYVVHPGYFRIAFDDDGDDDFMEPRSIKPVNDHRTCKGGIDKCGESDFYNNDTVLMDNLDPHVTKAFIDPAVDYTWEVQLPDVECDNCTLQIIQVMEDDDLHGPYSPKGASPEILYIEDIYHTCIDLVLKADATGEENPEPEPFEPLPSGDGDGAGDGDGVMGEPGEHSHEPPPSTPGAPNAPAASGGDSKCAVGWGTTQAGGAGASLLLGLLGLLFARRRGRA
jgi:hypothetical protein